MFQTLAAIVHILDVTFNPREEGVELSNPSLTSVIAGLLQIDPRELALCLVQEAMITRGMYMYVYSLCRRWSYTLQNQLLLSLLSPIIGLPV